MIELHRATGMSWELLLQTTTAEREALLSAIRVVIRERDDG